MPFFQLLLGLFNPVTLSRRKVYVNGLLKGAHDAALCEFGGAKCKCAFLA